MSIGLSLLTLLLDVLKQSKCLVYYLVFQHKCHIDSICRLAVFDCLISTKSTPSCFLRLWRKLRRLLLFVSKLALSQLQHVSTCIRMSPSNTSQPYKSPAVICYCVCYDSKASKNVKHHPPSTNNCNSVSFTVIVICLFSYCLAP